MTRLMKEKDLPASFKVTGEDLTSLFKSAARALERLMVDTKNVKSSQIRNINLQATNSKELLHKFLSELVYLNDTYQLVFLKIDLIVNEKASTLSGRLGGERLDKSRHQKRRLPTSIKEDNVRLTKQGKIWQLEVSLEP